MAKIDSIDNYNSFELILKGYKNKEEKWITTKILLIDKRVTIVNNVGEYFNLGELAVLIQDIKNLTSKHTDKIKSDFLEPNLEIAIQNVKKDTYNLDILFRTIIDYEHGEVIDNDKFTRRLQFLLVTQDLKNFIKHLEDEINYINGY